MSLSSFILPSGRLIVTAALLSLLLAMVYAIDTPETRAGAERPLWEHYGQHEATARFWLDDDTGPELATPQEEVDEQEHVY